jgi:hypothetical protein
MGDAAQGEPSEHKVFKAPLAVQPAFQNTRTPQNYLSHPGGDRLPKTLKTWRVQTAGKQYGGVVAFSYGFEDSPDAEILVPGLNFGKESGAAGVSRQGNILQWGYSAPPSQMTEAGQALFINCICYAHEFDNVPPLVRGSTLSQRMSAIRLGALISKIKDPKFFERQFGSELGQRFKGDSKGLVQTYRDNYELIYHATNGFELDRELQSLGITSNRRLSTLERLLGLLDDEKQAATARRLLVRYTRQEFEKPADWTAWLARNRAHMYFTDTGDYQFKIAPAEYPVIPGRVGVEAPPDETWLRVFGAQAVSK